jgi:protein-S-isoprenylcysteine O-methyltransferase Ste14
MGRFLSFIYGVIAYILFLVAFVYAIGFLGNLVVPKTIDSGSAAGAITALVIDLILLSLFAIQHSGMARPGFKKWWTRIIPRPIERSTFVLLASLILLLLILAMAATTRSRLADPEPSRPADPVGHLLVRLAHCAGFDFPDQSL